MTIGTNLSGPAAKFIELDKAMYKRASHEFVTLQAGQPGWTDWLSWRKNNGLSTNFMVSRGKWGVPSKYPPQGSIDTALAEYQAGTSSRKLET